MVGPGSCLPTPRPRLGGRPRPRPRPRRAFARLILVAAEPFHGKLGRIWQATRRRAPVASIAQRHDRLRLRRSARGLVPDESNPRSTPSRLTTPPSAAENPQAVARPRLHGDRRGHSPALSDGRLQLRPVRRRRRGARRRRRPRGVAAAVGRSHLAAPGTNGTVAAGLGRLQGLYIDPKHASSTGRLVTWAACASSPRRARRSRSSAATATGGQRPARRLGDRSAAGSRRRRAARRLRRRTARRARRPRARRRRRDSWPDGNVWTRFEAGGGRLARPLPATDMIEVSRGALQGVFTDPNHYTAGAARSPASAPSPTSPERDRARRLRRRRQVLDAARALRREGDEQRDRRRLLTQGRAARPQRHRLEGKDHVAGRLVVESGPRRQWDVLSVIQIRHETTLTRSHVCAWN